MSAGSLAEYGELARRLATAPGVDAVEVHLEVSDAHQTGKAVHVVRRDLPHGMPVLAKLAAGGDVASLARAAVDNGADAVVVTQGFPALVIDPVTLRPALGAGPGLLTGPAVHALALRCVWDVHEALPRVPVVGAAASAPASTPSRCCSPAPPPCSSAACCCATRPPPTGSPASSPTSSPPET